MTLYKVIETIKMLALKHPNINSAYEGNIYDIMNGNPQQKYASVVLTQQSHTQDDTYDHYGFNLFYVDRLVDDMEDNRVQIQSTGKSMLSNIIKAFCEEFDAECENINYQTFTERFADECAGVYCTITIDIVKDINCTEQYWDESWVSPMITVRNQSKTVQFTENGNYIIDYDAENYTGLGKVSVEVNVPDLNGSYDEGYTDGKTDGREEGYADGKQDGIEEGYAQGKTEGYNEGKTDGYTEGKTDGISEQKSKLESISISENGTYTREDGYNNIVVEVPDLNGSYDEGYDEGYAEGVEEGTANAGAIIAETAQVLNITENGVYVTKYSQPEDLGLTNITGYFDDGTPFYEYAQLNGKIFKTDITLQADSSVEIWWKPDFNFSGGYYGDGIFSTLDSSKDFSISVRTPSTGQQIQAQIGSADRIVKHVVENKWYHFVLSESGLVMDGETITSAFTGSYITNKHLYINTFKDSNTVGSANGYYGMIKIISDGVEYIIIPTENGFKNITTDTLLEVYENGGYNLSGLPESDGNLIRSVNVNVNPRINMQKTGLKLAYSTIEEVPEWVDWSGITNMSRMFESCTKLKVVPFIDTSKVTDMSYTFNTTSSLTEIPLWDTSNVTNLNNLFYLTPITTFPPIDTSRVKTMNTMFYNCSKLQYIPALNANSLTSCNYFFGYSKITSLTYFGGFIGLKINWSDNYGLANAPNLTYESCISILNNLYDFTGNGETPTSSQGKLKVNANFLTLVGDELSIGTNKGWTITA